MKHYTCNLITALKHIILFDVLNVRKLKLDGNLFHVVGFIVCLLREEVCNLTSRSHKILKQSLCNRYFLLIICFIPSYWLRGRNSVNDHKTHTEDNSYSYLVDLWRLCFKRQCCNFLKPIILDEILKYICIHSQLTCYLVYTSISEVSSQSVLNKAFM